MSVWYIWEKGWAKEQCGGIYLEKFVRKIAFHLEMFHDAI